MSIGYLASVMQRTYSDAYFDPFSRTGTTFFGDGDEAIG
jgi:hypothetical protein